MIRYLNWEIIDNNQVNFLISPDETITCYLEEGEDDHYYLTRGGDSFTDIFPDDRSIIDTIVGYTPEGRCPEMLLSEWPSVLQALQISEDIGLGDYEVSEEYIILHSLLDTVEVIPLQPRMTIPGKYVPSGIATHVFKDRLTDCLYSLYKYWQTYLDPRIYKQPIYFAIP